MPARPPARNLKLHGEYQLGDSNSLKRLIFSSQLCNMQIHRGHAEVTLKKKILQLNFSKKISQLWIGFSKSQTVRHLQGAQRSLQPWHTLISSDLLCLDSIKPHSYHINAGHLHPFPPAGRVAPAEEMVEHVEPVGRKHTVCEDNLFFDSTRHSCGDSVFLH